MKKRNSLIPLANTFLLIILGSVMAMPASAQTGVIAFENACSDSSPNHPQIMRGDGTGRVDLALPTLPPGANFENSGFRIKDVTTHGPVTVLYHVLVNNQTTLVPSSYVVEVTDVGGVLLQTTPLQVAYDDLFASFSPTGDRIAYYNTDGLLGIADVDRDPDPSGSGSITGFSNRTTVVDLTTIGSAVPWDPHAGGFNGRPDFSPDGSSVVVVIQDDLWLIHLQADGRTFGSAEQLTQTPTVSEWNPAFSPDGTKIAFTAGTSRKKAGVSPDTMEIYVLDLSNPEHAITSLTAATNRSAAGIYRDGAAWSPTGEQIAFSATGQDLHSPHNRVCGFRNFEMFLIPADGSSPATALTNTPTVEKNHRWGW